MHLRLDDVDGARAAIGVPAVRADVVKGDRRGNQRIEQAFGRLVAVGVEHCVGGQKRADVAHQHQAEALERAVRFVGPDEVAVGCEPPRRGSAAFIEACLKVAAHQPEPVAVDGHLVLGIDGRDGVFAVHDGGERALDEDVGDAGRIARPGRLSPIEVDVDVQAIPPQKNAGWFLRIAAIADKNLGVGKFLFVAIGEAHLEAAPINNVGDDVGVAARLKRGSPVEDHLGARHHRLRPFGIESPLGRGRAKGIGPVEGVIEAAPAGVGGVQRVAGVHHRHDELRPSYLGDLRIDAGGLDRERCRFGHDVTDLGQKGPVGSGLDDTGMSGMPSIDLLLQCVAPFEKALILRAEAANNVSERCPKATGREAGARQRFPFDEIGKFPGNLEAVQHAIGGHSDLSQLRGGRAAQRIRRAQPPTKTIATLRV
ncbi:MAG: hypothetical protein H6R00_4543 [Proteobacteria bacterium]|nr:hypothetical protein [Pseudomonadota bacterium]